MAVTEPGLYVMSLEEYLADPCPEPSLNHSLAVPLLTQSPWHAFHAHPKLNPEGIARPNADHFDLGTVVHELVLEGDDRIWEVHAKDWKTKAAKTEREEARAAGKIPLLTAQMERARAMAAAVARQVEGFPDVPDPAPLRNGVAERVAIWREGPIWCRARIDYLHTDFQTIDDLKTTGESAHPSDWSRTLFDKGLDLQVAFHCRGVQRLMGTRPDFRFLVVEDEPPYALSLIGLAPEAVDFAQMRMRRATELWGHCLRTGQFPGYATRPVYADLPPWVQTRWLERQYYEEVVREDR